ncbi:MAG TPA: sugar phosphate isomerase/epimerase family protein [Bryobacteraceae bacterium]|jgi:sugar phosphate isomerase/epimerase|nr:sugar phosphate isomerase/epimerase family protein [Bryobacteraceae bacterium]
MSTTRRRFLGASAGIAGLLVGSKAGAEVSNDLGGFKLGITTWSLRDFQRPLAIEMIKQLQTPYVSVKEFHLPYRSTTAELIAGRKEFENAGLRIMAGGNITLAKDDEADMRRYFDYAKTCGMPMIICAPTHQNLKLLESFVKEYNIAAAIHNHGPHDKNFPTPQVVLDAVRDLDPRVGLCLDVGHSAAAGVDIVQAISDSGPRLLDMHIKDVKSAKDESTGCDVGEGVLPIIGIFRALQKIRYRGCVNLEYEFNADAPMTGMLKSFAYMRGALAAMNS